MTFLTSEFSVFFNSNGLPFILLAWLFIYIFRPFATIIHELGHALPSAIFTNQVVKIRIGVGQVIYHLKFKKLEIEISLKKMICGYTAMDETKLTKGKFLLILASGPFFSLIFSIFGFLLIYNTKLRVTLDAIIIGWVCSHLICFLRNVLPINLQGTQEGSLKSVPSDGLQIYRLLR